jgi:hypothetical protein
VTAFLSPDELVALTRRRRSDAQARELVAMGIPYRARTDGTLAVLRAAVDAILGVPDQSQRVARTAEPQLRP